MLPLDVDEYGRPRLPLIPPAPEYAGAPGLVGMSLPAPTTAPIIPPTAPVGATAPTQIQPPAPMEFRIPPPSPLVTESDLFHKTEPVRTDPQFKRSGWTKFLDALVGGLAGAAKGPEVGYKVASELVDAPFLKAHATYATKAADYERRIKEEQARTAVGLKELETGRKLEETEQKRQEKNIKLAQGEKKLTQAEEHARELARHNKEIESIQKMRAEHKTDFQVDYQMYVDDPTPDKRNYAQYHQLRAAHLTPEQAAERSKAMTEASQSVRLKFAGPIAEASARGRLSVQEGVDPELTTKFKDLAKSDPMSVTDNLKLLPQKQRTQVLAQIDLPKTYTPAEKLNFDNAKTTLGHVQNLRKYAEDPYIKSHMGPILGRVQSAEGRIGGKSIGATPEETRKEGEFLNYITYVLAWEAKQLGGARPAWQLMQEIKKTGAKAAMDPARFAGALDAVENSVQTNMKSILSRSPSEKPKFRILSVEDVK